MNPSSPHTPDPRPGSPSGTRVRSISPELESVLSVLGGVVIVCDKTASVVRASPGAAHLRLIRRGRIAFEEIAECAADSLVAGEPVVRAVTVRRPPLRKGWLDLRVRAVPLEGALSLLLIDDLTEENRVSAVRRDFIANVSHELKTPVGAVSLLAEALEAATDDPDAVRHFAKQLQTEAGRLSQLISDVLDLSRVQGDDPMSHADDLAVDALVAGAVSYVTAAADAKGIAIVVGGDHDAHVFGDESQLLAALRNVLANAVAYSDTSTRVAVAVRAGESVVDIDVKDQGIGIPEPELDRIFERFYRVDMARSRATGGTGLGLSIVRNVCRNHGGDVKVWSVANEGSTFTIQLPRYNGQDPADDHDLAPAMAVPSEQKELT
ncbi:MAG: ATP-binding protein [Candidatus Nanopelagicales bacterium]|nr:ATP-binding protein [Candidatus Nanopelagicales bacterium]